MEMIAVLNEYIFIPEPHITETNFATRLNYVEEIKKYMADLLTMVIERRKYVDKLFLVWVGDIFDRGFTDPDIAIDWKDYFIELRSECEDMYSVLGNHEISYPRKNPFWKLVQKIESPFIASLSNKATKPRGKFPILRLVDELVDGEVSIHLGHFGRFPEITNKVNILLTHNSIMSEDMANILLSKYGKDQTVKYIEVQNNTIMNRTAQFDYVFIGHLHRAFSKFAVNNSFGQSIWRFMGSLGRTTAKQVSDDDLDRVYPCIRVRDGKLEEVIEIPFKLVERALSVNEIVVDKNRIDYELKKEKKGLSAEVIRTGDPVLDVMMMLEGRPMAKELFQISLRTDYCSLLANIIKE